MSKQINESAFDSLCGMFVYLLKAMNRAKWTNRMKWKRSPILPGHTISRDLFSSTSYNSLNWNHTIMRTNPRAKLKTMDRIYSIIERSLISTIVLYQDALFFNCFSRCNRWFDGYLSVLLFAALTEGKIWQIVILYEKQSENNFYLKQNRFFLRLSRLRIKAELQHRRRKEVTWRWDRIKEKWQYWI